jgi:Cd2+/Zn2+-exporting ATPase
MGGLGSDVALNAADVVIMDDKVEKLVSLVALGKRTRRVIRANLTFAIGSVIVLTIASFVWKGLFPNHLNWVLPFAVVGHEGSTVVVILNGLRLLRGPGQSAVLP